ncbi:hypothetical protein B484DRAFT_455463 [Ochromonadaceae sp. CCMP2298]|nr:hypothetical protein B484DRAFT_455463 [Ochromonadaceae sp. CCMP2298]|mmetsp:Transcript_16799/g.37280  ORF Transcript_16799/g.37280 Transcript_16799/m.37280 type:complete len:353 (+) Transcript_16799:50-1108(+)
MQVLVAVLLALAGVANVAAFRMPVARSNSMLSFARSVEMLVDTNIFSSPKAVPPSNFLDCVRQAAQGAKKAIADGYNLVEVEFPPLPLEFLEDSSSSARDIADANTRWAIEFSRTFVENGLVSIIYPDQPELDDAIKYVDMDGGANPFPNVTLATIRSDSIRNAGSLDQILMSVFGATVGGTVEAVENTKMYIALISSTQELPDLEKLHNLDPSIPLVFFNLRLDILRGDLGLPLFPGRDLHYRFLCKIRPAYLMRSRSFATSLRRPPFIVNYSGLLFRSYPEPYQSILNTGNGANRMVKYSPERPSNKVFRDNLTSALRVPGVPPEELMTNGNLVWWEKDVEKDESENWRM